MKIHFAIPIIFLSFFLSCTHSQVQQKLSDVESYIMERPDSALAVLESMDINLLVCEEDCAHHALLHAMALDKNFIDVVDDSLARVALDYYSVHGPDKYHVRSLYYLGIVYYYQGEYNKAMVEFTKAEKLAENADSLYLGMIKMKKSDAYSKSYNDVEALRQLLEAKEIFKSLSLDYYKNVVDLGIARAYFNLDKIDECEKILDTLIHRTTNINIQTSALANFAYLQALSESPDYALVDNIYKEILCERDNDFLSVNDYWAWAYSLNVLGRKGEARELIDQLALEKSGTSSYWQYMIAKSDNEINSSLAHLEDYIRYNDEEVSDALKQSLALSQRDYFKTQSELSGLLAERSRLWLSVVLLSSLVISILVGIGLIIYVRRQKMTKEKYILYISEIRHQLEEAKKDSYPGLKRKYLSLYKSKFATIGELCEQYVHSQSLVNAEKSIYKKVVSLVGEFTNDYTNREKFEAMLDQDLDNIMSNLRVEMPCLKEKDFIIFSFLAIGFDVTTISNLLNMTANTIYIRKSRMKTQILDQTPTHMEQFVDILG